PGSDAVNLVLDVDNFSAGASSVGFDVRLDNRSQPGSGTVIATDVEGNEGTLFIDSENARRPGVSMMSRVEPGTFALGESYPNPFASSTRIDFSLAEDRAVTLTVMDLTGREVARLVDGYRAAGAYSVTWDAVDAQGRSVAAGVYVYRIQAGDYTESKRLVVLN
ncbi:MAG: FlgD immunoglobulin-like domain containing protein, partial [Bacteroidota bacterium]